MYDATTSAPAGAQPAPQPTPHDAFAAELAAIGRRVRAARTPEHFAHLRKLERWGRLCSFAGYGTGWLLPNLFSASLIALGKTTRWAVMLHPISHRGYDGAPGVPRRYTSHGFAKGWRRAIDWLDWIAPDAWHEEHDVVHHFRLGEDRDPDQLEVNFRWLRSSRVPVPLRYVAAFGVAATWKWTYYAPTTLMEAQSARAERDGAEPIARTVVNRDLWNPLHPRGRELWLRCYAPYATVNFGVIPLAFLPLGPWAVVSTFANNLLAEVLANLHGFLVIAPNHTGDDLPRFDGRPSGRTEFYLRQVTGSVNYRTGGDLNDWLHGWLNYQIEHHLFPNLTLLEYQRIQPEVAAVCRKHGVPYVQQSVWKRAKRTLDVIVGRTSMKRGATEAAPPS